MSRAEIIRLSLVRLATSFLVILIVGILNRIMIAEFGINKILVGTVLSFQHLVTPLALYFGHLSDSRPLRGRRRVPYIVLGMALCCLPLPFLPDVALAMAEQGNYAFFAAIGIVSLALFGFGVAVSSIALHSLIVDRCPPQQRGEALTTVWIITLVGFIIAAPVFALALPAYDQDDLRLIFAATAAAAMVLTLVAVRRQEPPLRPAQPSLLSPPLAARERATFARKLRALIGNPQARVLFLFLAMADFFFFSQEYVLEAFGQEVFQLSVAYTTSFNLYMGVGILISMIGFSALFSLLPGMREKRVVALGCVVSSLSFGLLALSSMRELQAITLIAVFIMGFGKGIFNVGLARLIMRVARPDLSGLIMGMWAVVGGVAIGLGELGGGVIVDLSLRVTGNMALSYGILFLFEAVGLLLCLLLIALFDLRRFRGHLERLWPRPNGGNR